MSNVLRRIKPNQKRNNELFRTISINKLLQAGFVCACVYYTKAWTNLSRADEFVLKSDDAASPLGLPKNDNNADADNKLSPAMRMSTRKLKDQLAIPGQLEKFDRTRPIYVDIGLSDGADTAYRLSQGDSVVSVDAFSPWIEKAKDRFKEEIQNNRLMLFNVGLVATGDGKAGDVMPLYFKKEGSVIASFDVTKGCQNISPTNPKCMHRDVGVVYCEALLELIGSQVNVMKIDIEMLHHSCVRGLSRLSRSDWLPKYVCWEEHDKPFGSGKIPRPITDVKLILGMYELGYDSMKVVMQGPKAATFYGISKAEAGFGQGSGALTPEEMMHYRSYERNNDKKHDTRWLPVGDVVQEGLFAPGQDKPSHFFKHGTYYDICMRLGDNAAERKEVLKQPDNFPLSSYSASSA